MKEWERAMGRNNKPRLKTTSKVLIALIAIGIPTILLFTFYFEGPLQKEFLLDSSEDYSIPILAESITAVD